MAEHRASVLSASLRRYEDPERSRDPRIRALVAELRSVEPAPLPRAHFRAELRAQLVAVAPRLISEGTAIEAPRPVVDAPAYVTGASLRPIDVRAGSGAWAGTLARARSIPLARPLAIATALVAIFAMLLGSAVWVSKKALPGDALYSLKRANESVQLSLAGGPTAKGKVYLDLANNRVDEVSDLLKRANASAEGAGPSAAASINNHTSSLIVSTLDSEDGDVRDASQLLGNEAVSQGSARPLDVMTAWAPGQMARLQAITNRIPSGSLHDRAVASTQLVSSAFARAQALQTLAGCNCLKSVHSDPLGPVPCDQCTAPTSTTPVPGGVAGSLSSNATTVVPPPGGSTATGGVAPPPGSPGAVSTEPGGAVVTPTPGEPTTAGGASNPPGSSAGAPSSSSGIGGISILPSVTLPLTSLLSPILPPPSSSSKSKGAASTSAPACILNLLGICVNL